MCQDDEEREDDADQAFGEDVQGAAGGESPAEEAVWCGLLGWIAFGQPVAEERQREPEADDCVGNGDAGEDEDAEAGEQNERGVKACSSGVEGAACEALYCEGQREYGKRERNARCCCVDAEDFEA